MHIDSKLTTYLSHGIELDEATFQQRSVNANFPNSTGRTDYRSARKAVADTFSPIIGEQVTEKDFPSSLDTDLSRQILDSFTGKERQRISRAALFHEATSSSSYWSDTGSNLFPLLASEGRTDTSDQLGGRGPTGQKLTDLSAFVSQRTRDRDGLRGDPKAIEAFSSLLLDPEVDLSPPLRGHLAGHFFANARVQQRAERQFDDLAKVMPDEAKYSIESIKKNHLQAEVMNDVKYCSSLQGREFSKDLKTRQFEALQTMQDRTAATSRPISKDDRDLGNKFGAIRKLFTQSQEAAPHSAEVANINKQLLALSMPTRSINVNLLSIEGARMQKQQIHEANISSKKGNGPAEL